jgi:hypothetical protein
MAAEGRLVAAGGGSFANHSVELDIMVTLERDGVPVPLSLAAPVAANGSFTIPLPDGNLPDRGELAVRAPDGTRLLRRSVPISGAEKLEIAVEPQAPVAVGAERDPLDPANGPFVVRVNLITKADGLPAAGQLVALWGSLKQRAADAPAMAILAADYTDAAGRVRLEFARAAFAVLEVRLPGAASGEVVAAVALDKAGVPEAEVRIAADFPPAPEADEEDDESACACETPDAPRTPDHTDLVNTQGVFETDLSGGTCPSPAVANRTLEEFRYYSLVRTTDPQLPGMRLANPRPLPDRVLAMLAELSYGFGSTDDTLGGARSGVNEKRGAVSAQSFDVLRMQSAAYAQSGLATARAWRETVEGDEVRKEILARASALSEDTLRHALADPDGFTPLGLMTAERQAALDNLQKSIKLGSKAGQGRTPIAKGNMPQWDAFGTAYQAMSVAHGHILEWRQVWRADGYSLGDLLYSLPLAPGQKRRVSVVDWDREERGFRTSRRTFSESFRADLERNRLINEVVDSTVNEAVRAGSSVNTWAAGGGLGLGIPFSGGFFGLGVAGGAGGSSSNAWQNSSRALAASSGQSLLDRTNQAASAVRSQRATVVVGSEQSEGLSITSEIVANYNHCHAMTMEYFEVLQHFRVDQELAHVSECLFIPLEMRPFDMYKAQRWRDILQYRMRRPRLSKGFAAIERILQSYVDSGLPTGRYADEPITELSGELRLQLRIANPRAPNPEEEIDAYLNSAWNFWNTLFGPNTAKQAYDSAIADRDLANRIFEREYAPRVARAYCDKLRATLLVRDRVSGVVSQRALNADFTMVSSYRADGLHLVTFRATTIPAGVTRADIVAIRFSCDLDDLSPNSATTLRSANVVYATAYRQHELVPRRSMNNDIIGDDEAQIPTRLLSRSEERNPRQEDRDAVSALLKHLNEFVEHYHQVIWWRMDPNRRFMLLDGFIAPNSGGRSLASVVENRLISIVGNSLVMPVAPGYRLDPLMREAEDGTLDLLELYRPSVPPPPRRISLPTRGVHAEAILGECNSCMVRDDTRFWHWESEKFPGVEPPQIAETSTGTRRQTPLDTTPDDFAAPVVAIQNAPAAPDPTPITALGALLTQKDLFKDITGLEGNQKNAQAAFEQALRTGNAFAKMAAGGAKEAFANRNAERTMKKVDEARAAKILSEADAKEVVAQLLGVPPSKDGAKTKPLTEEPSVAQSLAKVQEKPGKKKVTVTSNTGSTSQTVEAEFESPPAAAAPAVSFRINGVPPLKQPSPETCWAVALTMLVSEQKQQSLPVETALLSGGETYVDMFRQGKPLPLQQLGAFIADFKLKDAATGVLTASSIEAALRRFGPLWVVGDEQAGAGFSVHARVITGIAGDGTPIGTKLFFNDPATGQPGEETLKLFTEKLAELMDGAKSAFGGIAPMVLAL